jgi:hypothetical protein
VFISSIVGGTEEYYDVHLGVKGSCYIERDSFASLDFSHQERESSATGGSMSRKRLRLERAWCD